MTRRTRNPLLDVRGVNELNVVGNPVDPDPIDRLRITGIVEQLGELRGSGLVDLRAVNPTDVVAELALCHRWDPRRLVRADRAVAELAIDARL